MNRSQMTHRATVQRNTTTAKDPYGHKAAPTWTAAAGSPFACRAYSKDRRFIVDGEKVGILSDLRVAFPAAADVRDGDRVTQIADRRGAVLYPGPMTIIKLQRRQGHKEAMVEGAAGTGSD